MEPITAAIMTTLAVLGMTAVFSHTRQTKESTAARHRRMALDRGLTHYQVLQLEHLANGLDSTSISDLVLSPARYNQSVQRYLESLTTTTLTNPEYERIVHQLTRLRRRVHPPRLTGTALRTSREMPEGVDVFVRRADSRARYKALVWGVNEDHFAVQFVDNPAPGTFRPNTPVTISIVRGHTNTMVIRTVVRTQEDGRCSVLHLEHGACEALALDPQPGRHLRVLQGSGKQSRPRTQWNPSDPAFLRAVPKLHSV